MKRPSNIISRRSTPPRLASSHGVLVSRPLQLPHKHEHNQEHNHNLRHAHTAQIQILLLETLICYPLSQPQSHQCENLLANPMYGVQHSDQVLRYPAMNDPDQVKPIQAPVHSPRAPNPPYPTRPFFPSISMYRTLTTQPNPSCLPRPSQRVAASQMRSRPPHPPSLSRLYLCRSGSHYQ